MDGGRTENELGTTERFLGSRFPKQFSVNPPSPPSLRVEVVAISAVAGNQGHATLSQEVIRLACPR